MCLYTIAGKKSASWQLVAVVLGLKTMPRGKMAKNDVKTRCKMAKTTQNQRNNSPKQQL